MTALLPLGSVTRCPTRFRSVAKSNYRARAAADFKRRSPPLRRESDASSAESLNVEQGVTTLPSLTAAEGIQLTESPKQRAMLWKAAMKLPLYWVPIIPVLVGAAVAYHETGILSIAKTLRLSVGGLFIIAWMNFSNDVFDSATGADVEKRESLVNLTRNKPLIFRLSLIFFVIGISFLGSVVLTQNMKPAAMLAGALACGYIYQGPPFRLSYKGLGELLCFTAFGPLATSAFYMLLANTTTVPVSCWAASVLVGITTSVVLFCSHFHQVKTDKAANKLSPVVRLGGVENGFKVLKGALLSFVILTVGLVSSRLLPPTLMHVGIVPALLGMRLLQFGKKELLNTNMIKFLKLYALDFHVSVGLALSCAFLLARAL